MSNIHEPSSTIYEQVVKEVSPYVKNQKKGLLYTVVQTILGEEKSKTQENTRKICGFLGINSSDDKAKDLKNLDNLLTKMIESYHPSVGKGKLFPSNIRDFFSQTGDDEMVETKWIILGACLLVGVGVCIKYIEEEKRKERERKMPAHPERRQQRYSPPPPPIPASLCLVVPANIVSTLGINSELLNARCVEDLLENTVYFLCANSQDADLYEQDLELINEDILPDRSREVYIRINISDGGKNLIDKTTRFGLKSNLPPNAKFTLEKLACLKDLSGLEKFNRV